MRIRVEAHGPVGGETSVPGDKSIAHRWLILASTARGGSRLAGLPASLDVRSMALGIAAMAPSARPALEDWAGNLGIAAEGHGSTWNASGGRRALSLVEVEGDGWAGLAPPTVDVDCGNAGTALRLLAGVAAGCSFRTTLTGDVSLSGRPMERVAEPLRLMGAGVTTVNGHAPVVVDGGGLIGITYRTPVPTAQVKSAVMLAGLRADGGTVVTEAAATRDHTERALAWLGAPVTVEGSTVSVRRFQHEGFSGAVPGDMSSAVFLLVAAAITGGELTIDGIGLNPSRSYVLEVLARMGVRTTSSAERDEVGEPVGRLWAAPASGLTAIHVGEAELPLIVDEIPILAVAAAHAEGESRFSGAAELRFKESDRLRAVVDGLRALGGAATIQGDDLVVAGGGLSGGLADAVGDHRIAMSLIVAGLAASGPVEVEGAEAADVSFPGFGQTLAHLGASLEEVG